MNEPFRLFPEQASAHAVEVDRLYFFLLAVSAFFVILIAAAILYFAVRYRSKAKVNRAGSRNSHIPLEILWSSIPLALTMIMFAWGAKLFFDIHQTPPQAPTVNVVAKQWMWKLQQPSGKREINELHLPVGQPVRLRLISEDVIHSFYIPAFRVKMDVLPDRYTYTWFTPSRAGKYHLFCAEYCGTSHSQMRGTIIVQEPADYADWLRGASGKTASARGAELFDQFRCGTCHTNAKDPRCPPLAGLYGSQVPLQGGQQVKANEAYLRESILDPAAKVVAGYQPIMPTYLGQIGEEDILNIIAYLKTLAPPESTSQRQEEAP